MYNAYMGASAMILEEVKRCKFCGREATVSSQEHAENPFCQLCLDERISAASRELSVYMGGQSNGYAGIILLQLPATR